MTDYQDLSNQMEGLDTEDQENTAFVFEGDVEEAVNKYKLCLAGRFLTEKSINVRVMKSKLADIWKSAMGINIKEIETGINVGIVQLYSAGLFLNPEKFFDIQEKDYRNSCKLILMMS